MAGTWSLRQLFTKRTSQRRQRDESSVTTGIIEAGDFRIDMEHRTAILHGKDLRLTPDEFETLVFLTSHPHRCVTPRTMLATSWTGERLRQTEFLKVLLALRKKIDAISSGRQYLRTEPWVVYRFDPTPSLASN